MGEKRRGSPREKKALSLARNCRNAYGNNRKAARTAIPRRKATESRRVRCAMDQALAGAERLDEAAREAVEGAARGDTARRGGWRKASNRPLGRVIARAQARRARLERGAGERPDA